MDKCVTNLFVNLLSAASFKSPLCANSIQMKNASPKIAFCKSELYEDLYIDSRTYSWRALVASSNMRSGPIGLFERFHTHFFIIKDDSCHSDLWKQKITDCGFGDEAKYLAISQKKHDVISGLSQADVAVSAKDIDWSCFDIVIAIDACISSSVTSQYPQVLWAYYVSEGCMTERISSRLQPVAGYDIYLNQRFRLEGDMAADPNKYHEIDFPYHLMNSLSIDRFFRDGSAVYRNGVFIDKDSRHLLRDSHRVKLEKYGPICEAGGTITDLLREIRSCKYFLRLGDRQVWGNASIEAVACGCLLISSTRGYANRIFGGHRSWVAGIGFNDEQFDDALNKMDFFEANPAAYNAALASDKSICDRYCYELPLTTLITRLDSHVTLINNKV